MLLIFYVRFYYWTPYYIYWRVGENIGSTEC